MGGKYKVAGSSEEALISGEEQDGRCPERDFLAAIFQLEPQGGAGGS